MSKTTKALALTLVLLGGATGCEHGYFEIDRSTAADEIRRIADDLWQHQLDREMYLRVTYGLPVDELPQLSLEDLRAEADFAAELSARLDRVEVSQAPHEDYLTARTMRRDLEHALEAPDFYWNNLSMSPYLSLYTWSAINNLLESVVFENAEELTRYRKLLADYQRLLDQHLAKMTGQEERGIRLPKAAIPGTIGMYEGFRDQFAGLRTIATERLAGFDETTRVGFQSAVDVLVDAVVGGYDRMVEHLSGEYLDLAPEAVGAAQFERGREFYRHRARLFTTVDMEPEEIHRLGLERVDELSEEMARIREGIGFDGDREAFHDRLRSNPRFLAQRPEEVGKRLMAHVDRMERRIPEYFSVVPKAEYGVRRLTPAEEVNSTFGYYKPPDSIEPVGYYNYNASRLDQRSMVGAASLIFHELLPGHHFQVALQMENESLHPYRQNVFNSAFAEGWAEYAASLGMEMGLYEDPYDHYGHLTTEIFLASRLVVDTGIGYYAWSLERAREFMGEHVFQSEVEIATETLRYATRPGQALAYRLGYEKIWELRHRAERELGEAFDIRGFHAAVLGSGTLPLSVLEEHIDWWIESAARIVP